MSVYQDLVEREGFTHGYNSVKRFVAKLRTGDPRFAGSPYLHVQA
jgi:hypothetical protein